MEDYMPFMEMLFPGFIVQNFISTSLHYEGDQIHIDLEESDCNNPRNFQSEGFFPSITVSDFLPRTDFLMQGEQVILHIKRRRWLNSNTGEVFFKDWTRVVDAKMINEYSSFFKEISGYESE